MPWGFPFPLLHKDEGLRRVQAFRCCSHHPLCPGIHSWKVFIVQSTEQLISPNNFNSIKFLLARVCEVHSNVRLRLLLASSAFAVLNASEMKILLRLFAFRKAVINFSVRRRRVRLEQSLLRQLYLIIAFYNRFSMANEIFLESLEK